METIANKETKDFFIVYKPKDIVSGDFYHAIAHKPKNSENELFFMCTADCTGHGVPGALMSMVGISRFNESIIEKDLFHPNEILDNVRKGIIASLNPEGSEEESKDGMDCVLCVYDFKNMKLEFAAANNPLWLIRNEELIEYKPDKMPVGLYYSESPEPFSLQTISLQKGDLIYTFTDGFADQFGGPKGKKYMYKPFQEKLLQIKNLELEAQKKILEKEFDNWKGDLEQIDDILIIGLKI